MAVLVMVVMVGTVIDNGKDTANPIDRQILSVQWTGDSV